jgi:succinyl-diaminopimelate desuccinylase
MDNSIGPGIRERISRAVEALREEIVDFARELIAERTENPPGRHYRSCVDAIARRMGSLGLHSEIMEVPGGGAQPRYCLAGSFGRGDRTLYFHGHYDVVPAFGDEQFRPVLKGNRLYGRGASDMKGGLASMIYAVKALKECGVPLDGVIGLTVVPDEETGGELGSAYLSKLGRLAVDGVGMLTPEPTGGAVWNASRGAVTLSVQVRGVCAHVGLSHEGVNAFEHMLEVARELAVLKAEVGRRTTAYGTMPERARGSILMMGGVCEGGTNFNVVPASCTFTVDRRINPEEDLAQEKARLMEVIERCRRRGIDVEARVLQEGEPSGAPEDVPLAATLSEAVRAVTGAGPKFEMCPGLLETRFYAALGVPAFAYGPGTLEVSHGPEEYVKVGALLACAEVYALAAAATLAPLA